MHPRNRLLAAIPRGELDTLSPDLEPMELPVRLVLHEPLQPISHVHFMEEGLTSMVNEPENGDIVEFATIGHEGLAGFPVVLGTHSVPSRAIVQIPGRSLRMRTADFLQVLPRTPRLHAMLLRYMMALLNQISHGSTCNRLHEVQERCARWLLLTHDRVEGDCFPLTQEFLSQMLGVHRPTVSVAASMLQKAGLIQYTRGRVTVIDRAGLEAASCSCYRTIRTEYDRLLADAERR